MKMLRKLYAWLEAREAEMMKQPIRKWLVFGGVVVLGVYGMWRRYNMVATGEISLTVFDVATIALGVAFFVFGAFSLAHGRLKRSVALFVVEVVVALIVVVRLDVPAAQALTTDVVAQYAAHGDPEDKAMVQLQLVALERGQRDAARRLDEYTTLEPAQWGDHDLSCPGFEADYTGVDAAHVHGAEALLSRPIAYCAHVAGEEQLAAASYRTASTRGSVRPAPMADYMAAILACADADPTAAAANLRLWREEAPTYYAASRARARGHRGPYEHPRGAYELRMENLSDCVQGAWRAVAST